ncbi:hypothetical protein ACFO0N_09695 [Halobium salinum]|uniref:Uncharacterized protein n=1 Tax=Halobium salinum TaxID=1364940 RepID=A0ABD5PCM2_9EURY|nr:hypothetical protein [Halobium salinum]
MPSLQRRMLVRAVGAGVTGLGVVAGCLERRDRTPPDMDAVTVFNDLAESVSLTLSLTRHSDGARVATENFSLTADGSRSFPTIAAVDTDYTCTVSDEEGPEPPTGTESSHDFSLPSRAYGVHVWVSEDGVEFRDIVA